MAFVAGLGPVAASAFTGQRVGAAATCPPAGAGPLPVRRRVAGTGAGAAKAVISTPRPANTAPGVKIATPMTLTEKILAKAAERGSVRPGDNIWVNTDVLMTHDVCGPGTIGVFKREFGEDAKVWDTEKVVIIPDHYIFTEDVRANRNVDILRDFVNEQGIKYFYDITDRSNYKAVRFHCLVVWSSLRWVIRAVVVLLVLSVRVCAVSSLLALCCGWESSPAAQYADQRHLSFLLSLFIERGTAAAFCTVPHLVVLSLTAEPRLQGRLPRCAGTGRPHPPW